MPQRSSTPGNTEQILQELELLRAENARLQAQLKAAAPATIPTEHPNADSALRESEERYRTLFENSPIGLGVANEQGVLLAYNDEMMRPGGYTREDIQRIGNVAALYADPQERDRVLALARKQGFLRREEVRFKRKDGSVYVALMSLQPITLAGQRGWQAMSEDITERKQAEAALLASEASLREAQRIAALGHWDWDIAANTVFWSDELFRITGKPHDGCRITVETYLAMVHPDDRARLSAAIKEAVEARKPFNIENRIIRPDGTVRTVHAQGQVSYNAAGKPERMRGTCQDITERKQLEAQLLQAQKIESVGRMAGGLAHEFNNLLTGIMGHTELMGLKLPAGTCADEINGIRQISLRAATLIRQMLGFARKQNVEPKVVNLNDSIVNMSRMLTRLIGENIHVVTVPAHDLHRVRIDSGQFEQILLNLALNARDAMTGGGTLTIETYNIRLDETEARQHGVAPGDFAAVNVIDSGPGMTEDVRSHLFEPFFTTKEFGKGTGLGLATCYGILKHHHGHIWGENLSGASEHGHGAKFTLILPAATETCEQPGSGVQAALHAGGHEMILLVEDEPEVRSTAASALRAAGYRVIDAVDGRDALGLAESMRTPADLLITDVVMPRMGGRELAERLCARWPRMSVLFISGYARDDLANFSACAHVDLQQKPFTPDTLVRKARQLLDLPRGPQ